MGVSHALSEKAIKKLGLDEEPVKSPDSEKVVQEWESEDKYWDEWKKKLDDEHSKWTNKVKNFFKYGIGWRTRDWWYDTKWYLSNLKTFKPMLKSWRSFDYHYQIDLFKFGLQQLAKALDYYGNEVEGPRKLRIKAINDLIAEIDRDYEEDVRARLNYSYRHGGKVTKYADGSVCFHGNENDEEKEKTKQYYEEVAKERKAHYQKIFDLLIGQDEADINKEIKARIDAMSEEEKESWKGKDLYGELYLQVFDGSGIEGWWD